MAVNLLGRVISHVLRSPLIANALDQEISLFLLGMTKHYTSVLVLEGFSLHTSGTRRPLVVGGIDLAVRVEAKHAHFIYLGTIVLLLSRVEECPLPFFLILGNMVIRHPD